MATLDEIRKSRLEKLAALHRQGIEPYPISASVERRQIADVAENFSKYEKEKEIVVAGRIMAIRGQGGLTFFTLPDGTGKFQGLLKKDERGGKIFCYLRRKGGPVSGTPTPAPASALWTCF